MSRVLAWLRQPIPDAGGDIRLDRVLAALAPVAFAGVVVAWQLLR